MIKYINSQTMGQGDHGWLKSHFHFSFADYHNPDNMHFGVLRVINDDLIAPNTGFDTHPHRDMEIITYIVKGKLTHTDSMGNERTLERGQVQYMSAGTGILHSEHNLGDETLRLLQIWIMPNKKGVAPQYGDHKFSFDERDDQWLSLVTSIDAPNTQAPIKIHADMNMQATVISAGNHLAFKVGAERQGYVVLIEGRASINGMELNMRDALEVVEEDLQIEARTEAHLLVMEMAKS